MFASGTRAGTAANGVRLRSALLERLHSANRPHGAVLVLDDHIPAFALRKRVRNDDARQDVGRRAGRVRNNVANDARRVGLGTRRPKGGGANTDVLPSRPSIGTRVW